MKSPRSTKKVSRRKSVSRSRKSTRKTKPIPVRKIKRSKTTALRKKLSKIGMTLSEARQLPGTSSLGKYKSKDAPFCGPAGGAGPMTFPVGTKKRAKNAVSRARNAPNPRGVKKCATDYAVKKGWMTKEHQKQLLK